MLLAGTLVACTADRTQVSSGESPRPKPQAPPKVEPARIVSNLEPARLKRCMPKERVDIASLAGRYYGPIDFATDQVETVRGIDFSAPGDIAFVDEDEFEQLLDQLTVRFDREERAAERWLNWSFGFWSIGEDNLGGPKQANAELVAGYYDPERKSIAVRQDGELDVEYSVLAHELAHAAVDQSLGLPKKKPLRLIDDRTLAHRALVEGDATLTELQVSARLSRNNKPIHKLIDRLTNNNRIKQQERYRGMPHALIERFVFPYRWGLAFVCSVYNKSGWKGVNRIYSRPPRSSAEVMFPQRYLSRHEPGKPAGFPKLPKPWKVYQRGEIGASHLKSMFEAPADQPQIALSRPFARAAAWDGGRYRLWGRKPSDRKSALGVSLVEHDDHAGVLCSSLMEWHELTFLTEKEVIADGVVRYTEPDSTTILSCRGRSVRLGMAPGADLAATIAGI